MMEQTKLNGAVPLTPNDRYQQIRRQTETLCEPLNTEDYVIQSMPDASPAKWHLAHTSWYFETFVLRMLEGYKPFNPQFAVLFNSYYVSVGDRHARPRRGLLSRPTVEETYLYRKYVDEHIHKLLSNLHAGKYDGKQAKALDDIDGTGLDVAFVVEVGLHHAQQHQELLLTDIKHALAQNPLRPALYSEQASGREEEGRRAVGEMAFLHYDEGVRWIGHGDKGFSFDNETPRHRTFVHAFEIADRLVTAGEYMAFMEDGGYERADLWLSNGWETIQTEQWKAPLYWQWLNGRWWQFTLHGMHEVDPSEPVSHVSYYEANAFARWRKTRLPTEAEWETAAQDALAEGQPSGNFMESGRYHPVALMGPNGNGKPGPRLKQMFGDVWEWTASPYVAYPGFQPWPGSLGEYNGKFMSSQMVLRGGSCFTPQSHIRSSYRNFFPPDARWQMTGIRLAR